MKNFKIIILNGAGCEIYNKIIKAENENKAIIEVLDNEVIYSDDTITIEEV